jgi:hypothetical protein
VSTLADFQRWFRKVPAHPNGALVHDGDCEFYNKHHKLCTCGLLHALKRYPDKASALYARYDSEISDHEQALEFLG